MNDILVRGLNCPEHTLKACPEHNSTKLHGKRQNLQFTQIMGTAGFLPIKSFIYNILIFMETLFFKSTF